MANKMKKVSKARALVAIIIVAAVVLACFDGPAFFDKSMDFLNSKLGTGFPHFINIPYRLGLDLQGGTQLVYEADTSKVGFSEKGDAVEGVRDVIERRVNAFGVAEPVVQVNKAQGAWRVIVELAGIKDVNEAIKMIGETPMLEFKVENTEPQRELTAAEKQEMNKFNSAAKSKANTALAAAWHTEDFANVVKQYTENEVGKETGGDLGWIKSGGAYDFLIEKAKTTSSNTVYPKLIDQDGNYYVMKVNDKREADKEVKANHILICFKGAERCDKETTKEDAKKKIDELKAQATVGNFARLARENSTEPGANDSSGDLGWFGKGQMVKPFEDVVFTLEKGKISDVVETAFGYHLIYKVDERPIMEYKIAQLNVKQKTEAYILPPKDQWKSSGLTGKQLKTSRVEFDQNTSAAQVALEFNDDGAKFFAQITAANEGKPEAIFLDGMPISIPRVNEAINEGKAVITGDFDITEAKTLSQRLNAGALPVPIKLISQQTVGASLGGDSLQKSLFAGLIGFALVIIFMILYYRLPGLLASISLLIYGVIVLFVFKAIPVTLTLSGIAGFILSVGMAVDANVLVFERLREELKLGKPLATSVEESFRRAWTAIRDGNYTTLIVCIVLMWFGTSMIKGFAFTLTIGVLASMFSAMVITRQLLNLLLKEGKQHNLWWFGVNDESKVVGQ